MSGQAMNKGKGIYPLGSKPRFIKGGETSGKTANGEGTKGGGSKDGGVSLDGGTAPGYPHNKNPETPGVHPMTSKGAGQRGSARGRSSNDAQSRY